MMQSILDILVFIALFMLITFQVVVLPRLQIGASIRRPDDSIPWLPSKSDVQKSRSGSSRQIAIGFSVFSLIWLGLHVGARFVMDLSWIQNPASRNLPAENPVDVWVQFWFGISFFALLLESILGAYVMLKTFWRDYSPPAAWASLPWAAVACYTFWIISPWSIDGG